MTAYKGLGTTGNAVGVVTPTDHKGDQVGMVTKTATPNLIRAGLFYNGTATIVTGTAGMAYSVAAYTCVTQRSSTSGAVFGGNDGALSVATTAAPGSNSRIDVVYHWHREFSLDGVDSNPVIGVVQGTAAASPTEPSLSAFPGAIKLATIIVPAGVTATNSGATITQSAPFTSGDNSKVAFRNTTEMNAWTTALTDQEALDLTSQITYKWNGSTWRRIGGGLVAVSPTSVGGTGATLNLDGSVTLTACSTANINGVFTTAFDDYEILIEINSSSVANGSSIRLRNAGSDDSSTVYATKRVWFQDAGAASSDIFTITSWSLAPVSAAEHTIKVLLSNPAKTLAKRARVQADAWLSATSAVQYTSSNRHSAVTTFDGFSFLVSTGNSTGTIRIYGYNNN